MSITCHTVTESTPATPSEKSGVVMGRSSPKLEESPAREYVVTLPDALAGGSGSEFFRCMRYACSWVGSAVLSRVLDSDYIHDLMCPKCLGAVVRALTCCDCHAVPAALGDERCGPCAVKCEQEAHETRMIAALQKAAKQDRDELMDILRSGMARPGWPGRGLVG